MNYLKSYLHATCKGKVGSSTYYPNDSMNHA